MRPFIIGMIVSATVSAAGLGAYLLAGPAPVAAIQEAQPTATAQPGVQTPQPAQQRGEPLVVEALVAPARVANLHLPLGGLQVAEVLVREGDVVQQGAPLVRLDTRSLQLAVDDARAALAAVRASYDELVAGASPATVAEAQARLAQAQAQLRAVRSQVTPQDIAAAQAQIERAQARLADLLAGPRPAEITQARAELAEAQAGLSQQRIDLSAEKEAANLRMEEAANEVRAAQLVYSRAYWSRQQAGEAASGPEVDALEQAKLELASAESALERAELAYQAARQQEVAGLAEGEARVTKAQAALDTLLAGPRTGTLADARAELAEARANLAHLRGEGRIAAVDNAAAAVDQVEAQLAQVTSDPSPASITRAQALIQQNEVDLKRASLALEQATLIAPMTGVVANVNVAPGEVVATAAVVVTLVDTSFWQLEVRGIDDLSVVRVQEGAVAQMRFYAIPGLTLSGKVVRVRPDAVSGEAENGRQPRATYTAIIKPDSWDTRLRWNMSAQVTILPVQ